MRALTLFLLVWLGTIVGTAQPIAKVPSRADPLRDIGGPGTTADYLETLAPIGWSPDGKFGYVTVTPVYPAMGDGQVVTYLILDAVTDKVAWSQEDNSGDWTATERASGDVLATSWKRNLDIIAKALAANRVAPGAGVEFQPWPLLMDDDGYSCSIAAKGKGAARTATVRVASGGKGAKTITSIGGTNQQLLACGFFKSPFAPRILTVTGVKSRVMDAGSAISYRLAGCALGSGFTGKSGLANLVGKWINEGEQARLEISADGACMKKTFNMETENWNEFPGRATVLGKRILVRWSKEAMAASEYEYRTTPNQTILWLTAEFRRSAKLPTGGQLGFYRAGGDKMGRPSIKGKWLSEGEQVSLIIYDDLTCLLQYEEGEEGKPAIINGRATVTDDRVSIRWGRDWWYGIQTEYQYKTDASRDQLWMTAYSEKSADVPQGGVFGFYKERTAKQR